jgi:hypothetical protein
MLKNREAKTRIEMKANSSGDEQHQQRTATRKTREHTKNHRKKINKDNKKSKHLANSKIQQLDSDDIPSFCN